MVKGLQNGHFEISSAGLGTSQCQQAVPLHKSLGLMLISQTPYTGMEHVTNRHLMLTYLLPSSHLLFK